VWLLQPACTDGMVLLWLVFIAAVTSGHCGINTIIGDDVGTVMIVGHGGVGSQDYDISWLALCVVIQDLVQDWCWLQVAGHWTTLSGGYC